MVEHDAAGRRVHPDPADPACRYEYDLLDRTVGITGVGCVKQAQWVHDGLNRPIVTVTGADLAGLTLDPANPAGLLSTVTGQEIHQLHDLDSGRVVRTDAASPATVTLTAADALQPHGPQFTWRLTHAVRVA